MKQKAYKASREKHILERIRKEQKKIKNTKKHKSNIKWKLSDREYIIANKYFTIIPVEIVIYTKPLNLGHIWTKILKDINYAYKQHKKTITVKYDSKICKTLKEFNIYHEIYYKILLD